MKCFFLVWERQDDTNKVANFENHALMSIKIENFEYLHCCRLQVIEAAKESFLLNCLAIKPGGGRGKVRVIMKKKPFKNIFFVKKIF